MEAGEEAGEVAHEHLPGGGELVVAQDAARDRLTGHTSHHEPGRAEKRAVVVGEHVRNPQPGPSARAHRVRFAAHDSGRAGSTGRIPAQDELLAIGRERPGLARRTAGEALQSADLDRRAERGLERGGEPLRCRR